MKTILTGANGFIGHEILTQCLLSPGITSIIALTRRDLPLQHPKLAVCKTTDFLNYSDAVLREIEGAEACIWYIFTLHRGSPNAPPISDLVSIFL